MKTHPIGMTVSHLVLATSMAFTSVVTLAASQDATDHTVHHPAQATSAPRATPAKTAAVKPGQGLVMNKIAKSQMDQMASHVKTMQDLHQKFMDAKTPEERNALMPEQMNAMQQSMGMMRDMSGMNMMSGMADMKNKMSNDMASHHQMMELRMEMMQSMMQMMMDRLPGAGEK